MTSAFTFFAIALSMAALISSLKMIGSTKAAATSTTKNITKPIRILFKIFIVLNI